MAITLCPRTTTGVCVWGGGGGGGKGEGKLSLLTGIGNR